MKKEGRGKSQREEEGDGSIFKGAEEVVNREGH